MSGDALEALFAQLPDGPMKDAMRAQDPDFAEEMLLDYIQGDEATQADIRAFLDSGGPKKVKAVLDEMQKVEDGTPTARDLEGWLS